MLASRWPLERLGDLTEANQLLGGALRPVRGKFVDAPCLVSIQEVQRALPLTFPCIYSPLRGLHNLPLPPSLVSKSDLTHVTTRGGSWREAALHADCGNNLVVIRPRTLGAFV